MRLVLLLLAAAAVQAAPAAPAADPIERELRSLVAHLHLRDEQRPAAAAYLAALHPPPTPGPDPAELRKLDPPGYLALLADGLRRDAELAEAARRAALVFGAGLTPEQRALWVAGTPGHADPAKPPPALVRQSHAEEGEDVDPADPLATLGYTAPDWVTSPTGDVLERLYPHAALLAGVPGRAVLRCETDLDGYASDCTVVLEEPSGLGFGNAALQATAWMRFSAAKRQGLPVRGVVTVPVNFKMAPPDADAAQPSSK